MPERSACSETTASAPKNTWSCCGETIESEEFEALFEGVLPPREGGQTPRRVAQGDAGGEAPEAEAPGGDEQPPKRRRGPAPQPA